jgi:hypothetical protein
MKHNLNDMKINIDGHSDSKAFKQSSKKTKKPKTPIKSKANENKPAIPAPTPKMSLLKSSFQNSPPKPHDKTKNVLDSSSEGFDE